MSVKLNKDVIMTNKAMECDEKESKIEALENEIRELQGRLDELIEHGEGGDQTAIRDLIIQAREKICTLKGEKFIEAY